MLLYSCLVWRMKPVSIVSTTITTSYAIIVIALKYQLSSSELKVRFKSDDYFFFHIILCFSLDAISERNPRIIDEDRAKRLAHDLNKFNCTYFETCATYGLNVEKVFQDGKHFILVIITVKQN